MCRLRGLDAYLLPCLQFADGLAYNKAKLEAALFSGQIFSNRSPKIVQKVSSVKEEDVTLIVRSSLAFKERFIDAAFRSENLKRPRLKLNVH